jgi:hypothetical protein
VAMAFAERNAKNLIREAYENIFEEPESLNEI